MSILIKGMEMPKNCTRCDHIGLNVAIGCPVMSGTDGRATDCPLVDLGKHGDLIDRDELRAEFPEPIDIIDPQQALVHITGVWAEIDCADVVIEAEDCE